MNTIVKFRDFYFKYRGNNKYALNNINLDVREGEIFGIIGESGSGKTTLLFSILGLLYDKGKKSGEIFYKEKKYESLTEIKKIRWKEIAIVFQNQLEIFNPRLTIEGHIFELISHLSQEEKEKRINDLFDLVKLDKRFMKAYPHELSGGMRQKVLIISALSCSPKLLLIDEPTTSLEGISKIEILNILKTISANENVTILITSHDLQAIKMISQKVLVMHEGNIVEMANTDEFLRVQSHPYSRGLVQSSPYINIWKDLWGIHEVEEKENTGCSYFDKCSQRISLCEIKKPEFKSITSTRKVACHLGGIVDILNCKNISKIFIRDNIHIQALSAVAIKIRVGEIVSIMGESGSGKTTLAEILVGIKKKDEGEILFSNKKLADNPLASFNGIQIVFQDPTTSMNPNLKVIECLKEPFLILKKSSLFLIDEVKKFFVDLGIPTSDSFLNKKIKTLSGGELQRLSIIRALLLKPKLLIADEITSMLDPSRKANLLRLLKYLQNKYGFSMLFITHDIALAQKISDYIYIMKNGRIIEEGTSTDIFSNPQCDYTRILIESLKTTN